MAAALEAPVRPRDEEAQLRPGRQHITGRRICMVVHSLYPEDPRVRREAKAAVDGGHAVDIICLRAPGQPKSETVRAVRVRRLPVQHLPGAGPRRLFVEYLTFTALATLVLIPSALRRRYGVIHVHNPPDFLIVAGLIPRLFGSRLILDIHDLSSHMFRSRFSGRAARCATWLLDLVELWATRAAHVVMTVHEPYRRELIAHGVRPGKLIVVMNVIERTEPQPPRRQSPRLPGDAGTFTLAYAGTIAPWYGVDLIIDALAILASELSGVRAVIFGAGDALAAARALAAAKGVTRRVEFSGRWLDPDDLLDQLGQANCGVIPNLPTELNRFALSTKLFEYIELGLPAVVSGLETLKAHFNHEEVTFFEPGDARSLAAALRWVAVHPVQAETKTRRARARVARQYSWAASRARYLAALTGDERPDLSGVSSQGVGG